MLGGKKFVCMGLCISSRFLDNHHTPRSTQTSLNLSNLNRFFTMLPTTAVTTHHICNSKNSCLNYMNNPSFIQHQVYLSVNLGSKSCGVKFKTTSLAPLDPRPLAWVDSLGGIGGEQASLLASRPQNPIIVVGVTNSSNCYRRFHRFQRW